MLARLLATALLLTGCGVGFVDPAPAQLTRVRRTWSAEWTQEPIVYGAAFDLQMASAEECSSAKATLRNAIAQALSASGAPVDELPFQDLAPTCQQTGNERLDLASWQLAIQDAEQRFAGANVRPVFIFADNLPGPVPDGLASDLVDLESLAAPPVLSSELWTLVHPALTLGRASPDLSIAWTDAADPSLVTAVSSAAAKQVPFESLPALFDAPLLDPGAAASAFKICGPPPAELSLPEGVEPGIATDVAAATPPLVRIRWPDSTAIARSQATPMSVSLEVEACSGNCDRFALDSHADALLRWATTQGCFLARSSE